MKSISQILLCIGLLASAIILFGCKSVPPVSIDELPKYPGVTEIELNTGDPALAKLVNDDNVYRKNMDATQHLARRAFRLPQQLTDEGPANFYSRELRVAGWSSRWGWVPMWQTYDRGSQMLTLVWAQHDPVFLMSLDEDPNQ